LAKFLEIKTNIKKKVLGKRLKKIGERIDSKLRLRMRESLEYMREQIAEKAPEVTGTLREQIRSLPIKSVRKRGFKIFEGRGNLDISLSLERKKDQLILWVDRGTGIFGPRRKLIKPTTKPFMYFEINGVLMRKKTVKGQKPQRFIEKGLNASKLIVGSKVASALRI